MKTNTRLLILFLAIYVYNFGFMLGYIAGRF